GDSHSGTCRRRLPPRRTGRPRLRRGTPGSRCQRQCRNQPPTGAVDRNTPRAGSPRSDLADGRASRGAGMNPNARSANDELVNLALMGLTALFGFGLALGVAGEVAAFLAGAPGPRGGMASGLRVLTDPGHPG